MDTKTHELSRAVFLDRDGVLIEDVDLLTKAEEIRILPGVPEALMQLRSAGFRLVVVSNQTVVARGLASEDDVRKINAIIDEHIQCLGGPRLDAFHFCPHHPKATLSDYRVHCECRKPRAGLILAAAKALQLDLSKSFMIGDRITDIVAGATAGTSTILVETGKHLAAKIETSDPLDPSVKPDFVCPDLRAAAKWILKK